MKIYNQKDVEILDIEVGDNSFRYRSIMKDDSVTLYYSLTNHVEIPVGSYIILPGNQRYTLYKPENFSKKGTRNFEYTVIFNGEQELLKKYKYKFITRYPEVKNTGSEEPAVEKKIKTYQLAFPMTAKPMVFLQLMVDNLNLYNPAGIENKYIWKVGDCVVDTEKALSFNHEYCYDVLNRLASEFNTEWEIENRTIHLRKVEKNKQNPLPLSYGKGNGFKTGIGRQTQGDKPPVTRLYVQGGERNIYEKDYGCKTLLLPLDKELVYEGRRYRTDTEGTYIYRSDIEVADINEDSLDASHIYPKWEGTVSELLELNEEKNICKFKIVEPAKQPDFTNARMPDEKATVIFQSGRLTGLEFNLTQDKDTITGYNHTEGSFEIEIQENGGVKMPNETLRIEPGDRFAVFHIKLPQEYICDDKNQKGGSWDMFREAARYMYEHEEEQFSFTGELDGIWAKKDWLKIGGKILPGGYVQFSDSQFQPAGILIRITGVKDYINNPHSPEIELSNIPVEGFVSNDLGKIDSNEVTVETNHKNSIEYTKRRWRDAQETISMLENAIDGFSSGVSPLWVQTMSVLVGDERLQFRFVKQSNKNEAISPDFSYNRSSNQFSITAATPFALQHMTLGINYTSPSHKLNEYHFWNMSPYQTAPLDNEPALYLYAVCRKGGGSGYFTFLREAKKMEEANDYYFLVGVLSSDYEGERSFTTLYGFTEVLPGRITTKLLRSSDGNTTINLETGEITGKITFTSGSKGLENVSDWNQTKSDISDALSEAQNASDKANAAKSTADDKAKVFYSPDPPTGMKNNDLWGDGTYIRSYNKALNRWEIIADETVKRTEISGGLITTGTIVFGRPPTGGMTGEGLTRIWAGSSFSKPTFRVEGSGMVHASNSIIVYDVNEIPVCGFSSSGSGSSLRIWAGATYANRESAAFKVYNNGQVYCGNLYSNNGWSISGPQLQNITSSGGSLLMRNSNSTRRIGINTETPLISLMEKNKGAGETSILLELKCDRSQYNSVPKTWINCVHETGWGSKFVVESRYFGDSNQMERTVVNVGGLMSHIQLQQLNRTPDLYPLYYDNKTGYLCYKY